VGAETVIHATTIGSRIPPPVRFDAGQWLPSVAVQSALRVSLGKFLASFGELTSDDEMCS
jgi:hypothetical protein